MSSGKAYENYYLRQSGRGLPVFYGARSQKGHGLGNMLKGLWRHATPLLKDAGRQALKTGLSVVTTGILKPKGGRKIKTTRKKKKRVAVRTPRSAKSPSPRSKRAALKSINFRGFSPLNQSGSGRIRTRRRRKVKRAKKDIFHK